MLPPESTSTPLTGSTNRPRRFGVGEEIGRVVAEGVGVGLGVSVRVGVAVGGTRVGVGV